MAWKEIVGRQIKVAEYERYLEGLGSAPAWVEFVVVHNTGNPALDPLKDHGSWYGAKTPPVDRVNKSLVSYYRDQLKWSSGPHFFVDREGAWIFTPTKMTGTHSFDWNPKSWGVEMAGDFSIEKFDERVRDNAVALVAALLRWRGLPANDQTIRLHKENKRTDHDCPGKNVNKADFVRRVAELLERPDDQGDHHAAAKETSVLLPDPVKRHIVVARSDFHRSPGGEVVGHVLKGLEVSVLSEVNGWAFVQTPGGFKGYLPSTVFTSAPAPKPATPTSGPVPTVVLQNKPAAAPARPVIVPAPAVAKPAQRPLRAFCFYGFGEDVTSHGMKVLADRLGALPGVKASVHTGMCALASMATHPMSEEIAALAKQGYGIVLIGNSLGGTTCAMIARDLGARGVPVDLVNTYDPTRFAPKIGTNVRRLVNWYNPFSWAAGGALEFEGWEQGPTTPTPLGNTTSFRCANGAADIVDLSTGVHRGVMHVAIDDLADLQENSVKLVKAIPR